MTLIHGATLAAANSIVREGISQAGRLRVHFYESDLEGRPKSSHPPGRLTSEVIIVVSAEKCARFGMVCYRASNGAILGPGLGGVVPTECILCVRRLPDYAVLWSPLSQRWGSESAPLLGAMFTAGGESKRMCDRLEAPRRVMDSARSSAAASPQVNPYTDDLDTPCYTVETMEKRKKSRRTPVETDHSPVTSGNEWVTGKMTREILDTSDQVTIVEDSTSMEMHMGLETDTSNNTTTRSVRTGAVYNTADPMIAPKVNPAPMMRMSMLLFQDHVITQKRPHLHNVLLRLIDRRETDEQPARVGPGSNRGNWATILPRWEGTDEPASRREC